MIKQVVTAKRLAVASAVLALAVLAVKYIGSPDHRDTASAPEPARAASAQPAPVTGPASPAPAQMPSDRPPLTPEENIEAVLQKDKQLALFMQYKKSVLLDAVRRDEYRKLLSDTRMLNEVAAALMQPGSGPVAPEEHYHRLMQIDYLDAAMTWKDNPQRAAVLEASGGVISKDNFVADLQSDRKQMLAGNKMELYRKVYDQDPDRAEALVAQAQGTRMEPLLRWMSQENARRRDKESEIRTEMANLAARP